MPDGSVSVLRPSLMVIPPLPFCTYWNLKAIEEEHCKSIMSLRDMHCALESMHTEIMEGKCARCTRVQMINNARNNVLPLDITMGDYVRVRSDCKLAISFRPSGAD